MPRRAKGWVLAAGGLLVSAAVLWLVVLDHDGDGDPAGGGAAPARDEPSRGEPLTALAAVRSLLLPGLYVPGLDGIPPPGPDGRYPNGGYGIAYVRRSLAVPLYDSPDGQRTGKIEGKTEFNSPTTLSVARAGGGWLGVRTPAVRGGMGWIRLDPRSVALNFTHYTVHVSVAERRLVVRLRDRDVSTFPVTVGRAGSQTPPGEFGITDALAGNKLGPWYGCCILALSGHQPSTPPGWLGGDRIAIHGTPGAIGEALSAGCIRARNLDMVQLFARVPLGAPVFVAA